MKENRLRTLWHNGQAAVNGWLAIANGFSAETMAHQGWDSLTVDLQHGIVDYQSMVGMLQAISTTPTVPVVRVPWLEPASLMKALDAGAYALICPMVNTRDEAAKLVAWTTYAPKGTRSFGPMRGLLYGGPDYPQHADATIVRFAMIETAQALDNLDAILSVEGIDAIYIGPSDLSLALGVPPTPRWAEEPLRGAIARILAAAHAHGRVAGIFCGTLEMAVDMRAAGFDLGVPGNDAILLRGAAQAWCERLRAG